MTEWGESVQPEHPDCRSIYGVAQYPPPSINQMALHPVRPEETSILVEVSTMVRLL